MSSAVRLTVRAQLTPQTLLSLEELLEVLPVPPEEARAWVGSSLSPVGAVAGEALYLWGDVVGAMTEKPVGQEEWLTTDQAAVRLGVSRRTLDRMVAAAPPNLPGGPISGGSGRKRKKLLWEPDRLNEWLGAFREWEAGNKPRRRGRQRPVRPRPEPASEPVDWGAVVAEAGQSQ